MSALARVFDSLIGHWPGSDKSWLLQASKRLVQIAARRSMSLRSLPARAPGGWSLTTWPRMITPSSSTSATPRASAATRRGSASTATWILPAGLFPCPPSRTLKPGPGSSRFRIARSVPRATFPPSSSASAWPWRGRTRARVSSHNPIPPCARQSTNGAARNTKRRYCKTP